MQEADKPARYDAVIVGGGAAGLMCALTAGQRGRRVALIEHSESVGKKIAISGGGRCNFTNIHATAANYLSASPGFCKSALARYTPWDFIALVEKHRIAYHEKKLGQQFCDGSSREIIAMLLDECAVANVEILCNCRVREVRKPDRFVLETNRGPIECDSLVIATGGLSFVKLGATDFGHRAARQFGLRVTEMRPGLVPLTFDRADGALGGLSGVSLPVVTQHRGIAFEEAMLFTHRGISGPAILQISSYWRENETLRIDLLPAFPGGEWLFTERQSQGTMNDLLEHRLPRRFAEAWCARHAPSKPLAHFKTRELESVVRLLHEWPLNFSGTEGYPKAEVTLGGVDTRELSSKTMESAKVPGLYFIGEVVDVTGWLGGYNFQWAWASGNAAGQFV
jgi:predicted Rossmann fold flavoprotein